jgi:hypothetical protein
VLFDYAAGLPGWMQSFAPAAALPVLAEMAGLEALRLHAFHAAAQSQPHAEPAALFSLLLQQGLVIRLTHLPMDLP